MFDLVFSTKYMLMYNSHNVNFKSELLADKLATNLAAFSVHKVTVRPDEWASWLQQNCSKHGFKWDASPVVWRELTERGGRGSLLGG